MGTEPDAGHFEMMESGRLIYVSESGWRLILITPQEFINLDGSAVLYHAAGTGKVFKRGADASPTILLDGFLPIGIGIFSTEAKDYTGQLCIPQVTALSPSDYITVLSTPK